MNKQVSLVQRIATELEHQAFMQVLENIKAAQQWGIKALQMSHEIGDDITTIERGEFAEGLKSMCIAQRQMVTAFSQAIRDSAEPEMVVMLEKKADEALDQWMQEIDDAAENIQTKEVADV